MKIIDVYWQDLSVWRGVPESSFIVSDHDIEDCTSEMINAGAIRVDVLNPGESLGCSPAVWRNNFE